MKATGSCDRCHQSSDELTYSGRNDYGKAIWLCPCCDHADQCDAFGCLVVFGIFAAIAVGVAIVAGIVILLGG
jgi:hypothetical protein